VVTEVIAAQALKYWGLKISLKINVNSKQTHIFPGGRGASPPHPPALTSNNSDITSGSGRLVVSVLKWNLEPDSCDNKLKLFEKIKKNKSLSSGGRGASPPHPPALTSNNSDINSVPARLVVSGLISGEQLKQLGLEFRSKLI